MLNFRFRGRVTFDDYLKMIRRLTNKRQFIFDALLIVIIIVIYAFLKTPVLQSVVFIGFALIIFILNYLIFAPKRYKRLYEQNAELQKEQAFDFYEGMSLAQPIFKVTYFDDAVYLYMSKNEAMILKKEWLNDQSHWSAFQGFLKVHIDPKTKK